MSVLSVELDRVRSGPDGYRGLSCRPQPACITDSIFSRAPPGYTVVAKAFADMINALMRHHVFPCLLFLKGYAVLNFLLDLSGDKVTYWLNVHANK